MDEPSIIYTETTIFEQKAPAQSANHMHYACHIPKYNELGIDMSAYERMDGHGVDRCKFLNDHCN